MKTTTAIETTTAIQTFDANTAAQRLRKLIGNHTGFASFEYTNKNGEVSRHTVIVGPKYENVLRNSIQKLEVDRQFEDDWDQEIVDKVLDSMNKSLRGENEQANKVSEHFIQIGDNMKVAKSDGSVYIGCLTFRKKVLKEGTYGKVNSRPATIERRKIEKLLPKSSWRTFKLAPGTIVKFNKREVTL